MDRIVKNKVELERELRYYQAKKKEAEELKQLEQDIKAEKEHIKSLKPKNIFQKLFEKPPPPY